MKKSECWFQNNLLTWWVLWACLSGAAWAGQAAVGAETLTKDVWGAFGGADMTGGNTSLALCAGEQLAGHLASNSSDSIISGYLGGYFAKGTGLQLLGSSVGTNAFYQDSLQVGVPLEAPVNLSFSAPLQPGTLPFGITVWILLDHLGQTQNTPVAVQYILSGSTVTLTPAPNWQGDTFYDVVIAPGLLSTDGFTMASPVHVQFVTALDPRQENVVLHPIGVGLPGSSGAAPALASLGNALHMDIPTQALADFSLVLINPDPLHAPRRVDPLVIQEANRKTLSTSGGYSAPIALQEVNGYNLQGQTLNTLSREGTISMSYDPSQMSTNGGPALVRSSTLALWALDETHRLWVKLPDSSRDSRLQSVSAPLGKFSVFALMGSADGNAAESVVFPDPWRPHGPNAGNGPGQTGTEQGGMTFSGLPSECIIKIYTLSGDLVRVLHHSDTSGSLAQEPWDGLTTHGEHAASGVYLWRVESASDGKNGKLMIIR